MGGTSGLGFDASALPTTAPLPWQTTSCADDVCQDRVVESYEETQLNVENDQLGEGPATARLKVVAADGTALVDSTTEVTPQRRDVNGRGCGPFIWTANVLVAADGTLTAAPSE